MRAVRDAVVGIDRHPVAAVEAVFGPGQIGSGIRGIKSHTAFVAGDLGSSGGHARRCVVDADRLSKSLTV